MRERDVVSFGDASRTPRPGSTNGSESAKGSFKSSDQPTPPPTAVYVQGYELNKESNQAQKKVDFGRFYYKKK